MTACKDQTLMTCTCDALVGMFDCCAFSDGVAIVHLITTPFALLASATRLLFYSINSSALIKIVPKTLYSAESVRAGTAEMTEHCVCPLLLELFMTRASCQMKKCRSSLLGHSVTFVIFHSCNTSNSQTNRTVIVLVSCSIPH